MIRWRIRHWLLMLQCEWIALKACWQIVMREFWHR